MQPPRGPDRVARPVRRRRAGPGGRPPTPSDVHARPPERGPWPAPRSAPSGGPPATDPGSSSVPPGGSSGPASTVQGLVEATRNNPRQRSPRERRSAATACWSAAASWPSSPCSSASARRCGDDDPSTTATGGSSEEVDGDGQPAEGSGGEGAGDGETAPTTPTGLAAASTFDGWVDPASSGEPWSTEVVGQLTFRGNPTRSYYGLGPVPEGARRSCGATPRAAACAASPSVGGEAKTWCGTGWTGQPAVCEDGDKTWVAFGAYDKNIHFLDAADAAERSSATSTWATSSRARSPATPTGSRCSTPAAGPTSTSSPLDRPDGQPESLWSMDADDVSPTKWNNDWDSSPLVIDDYLFEGGENGQWSTS